MNLLTSWTWRRAMKPWASTVHHPSLRLPRKICGLFDIGFAGGILDVTSMDSDAPAALSGNPFSPGGLSSADAALFDSLVCSDDVAEALFNSLPPHLISSLSAPEDSMSTPNGHFVTDLPATDSLDAFLNLDGMLDQDLTFDGATDINLLNANPLFEKTVYSLLELESFASKQPTFLDLFSQATTASDISNESIIPGLFEKYVSDSSSTTSSFNPSLNLNYALNQDHKKTVLFECAQKKALRDGSKIASNLLSMETKVCSHNIDSNVKQAVTNRRTGNKQEKGTGLKRSKEKRKSKVCDLEDEAEMLILKNEKLRQKITELEKLTKEMKAKLVASIAGKSPAFTLN